MGFSLRSFIVIFLSLKLFFIFFEKQSEVAHTLKPELTPFQL